MKRSLFQNSIIPLFLLLFGCATTSEWPEGTNIQITRVKVPGKMLASADVIVKSGHVPLSRVNDGQTVYGRLNEGTYPLTAESRDPFAFSEFSADTWVSPPYELKVEKGKRYELEIVASSPGWIIRPARRD